MPAPALALGLLSGGIGTKVAGLGLLKGVGQAALAAAPFVPSLMQGLGGDPLAGAASGGATALAGKYGIGGKHKAATQAITGILAPMLMPSVLGGVGNVANAAGNLISGAQARQREGGGSSTALGIGEGKKIGDMTAAELREFMGAGYAENVAYTREMMPLMQQHLDQQQNRQMQLNQQLGQITGALNKQKYMAGLAAGAQQQAGATGRAMINSVNPYADSVFRYQG